MATVETIKFRPRGPVYFHERDETTTPASPQPASEVHCVKAISLALNIAYITSISKCGAVDVEDARDIKSIEGSGKIDFQNITPEALVLAFGATKNIADAAPVVVTNEELPDALQDAVEGATAILGGSEPNFTIAALVVRDSATAPATLVLGTHYTLDAAFGMIAKAGDWSGYTLPIKASYTRMNPAVLAGLKAGRVVRWIRFNATNYVNASKILPVDIFKAQVSPTTGADLLPDDYMSLSVDFSIQLDTSRPTTDPRGQLLSIGNS